MRRFFSSSAKPELPPIDEVEEKTRADALATIRAKVEQHQQAPVYVKTRPLDPTNIAVHECALSEMPATDQLLMVRFIVKHNLLKRANEISPHWAPQK